MEQEGFVKGKAPVAEQDAFVRASNEGVAKLAPEKGGEKEEVSPEATAESVAAVKSAIQAKDGTKVTTLLAGANKAVLDEIGKDSALVKSIADLPEKERNAAYDYLHFSITDGDLLVDIIYQRFGVMLVGKDQNKGKTKDHLKGKKKKNEWAGEVSKNKVNFSAAHAQQIYSGYLCVPQAALDKITFVFSETDDNMGVKNGYTYVDGYAETPTNNICLNSQAGAETERNGVSYSERIDLGDGRVMISTHSSGTTESDKDASYNTVGSQWTAIHELGHVIDSGAKFSGTPEFRACSGWRGFDDSSKVVSDEFLKDNNVDTPYLENFTKDEQQLTQDVATEIAKTGKLSSAKALISKNKKLLSNYTQEQFEELVEDSYESPQDETTGVNLLKAASLGLYEDVWYDSKGYSWMDKHMKRPAHVYRNHWWSYDRATRASGKISCYQYVFPKEDFAEAYACYYYTELLDKSEKAGGAMPAKLKAWFDTHKEEIEK